MTDWHLIARDGTLVVTMLLTALTVWNFAMILFSARFRYLPLIVLLGPFSLLFNALWQEGISKYRLRLLVCAVMLITAWWALNHLSR